MGAIRLLLVVALGGCQLTPQAKPTKRLEKIPTGTDPAANCFLCAFVVPLDLDWHERGCPGSLKFVDEGEAKACVGDRRREGPQTQSTWAGPMTSWRRDGHLDGVVAFWIGRQLAGYTFWRDGHHPYRSSWLVQMTTPFDLNWWRRGCPGGLRLTGNRLNRTCRNGMGHVEGPQLHTEGDLVITSWLGGGRLGAAVRWRDEQLVGYNFRRGYRLFGPDVTFKGRKTTVLYRKNSHPHGPFEVLIGGALVEVGYFDCGRRDGVWWKKTADGFVVEDWDDGALVSRRPGEASPPPESSIEPELDDECTSEEMPGCRAGTCERPLTCSARTLLCSP